MMLDQAGYVVGDLSGQSNVKDHYGLTWIQEKRDCQLLFVSVSDFKLKVGSEKFFFQTRAISRCDINVILEFG